jgi:hypothetical protein
MGGIVGNDFIVVSGFSAIWENVTKKVFALNTVDPKATWREMDEVPTEQGFSHAAFAIDENNVYICGSYVGPSPGPDSPTCLKYNHVAPKGTQWSFLPDLPAGRGGGGLFHLLERNSILYATGAIRHGGTWLDYTTAWELKLDNLGAGWSRVQDIPYAANHISHVTALYNGKRRYFMSGGQEEWDEENRNVKTNVEFDVDTMTWIKRADMPFGRGHTSSSTVAYGCGFLIMGGAINGHARTADISYYGIDTDSWTSIGNLQMEVNTPICDIAYLNDGDWIYCATGPISLRWNWRIKIQK